MQLRFGMALAILFIGVALGLVYLNHRHLMRLPRALMPGDAELLVPPGRALVFAEPQASHLGVQAPGLSASCVWTDAAATQWPVTGGQRQTYASAGLVGVAIGELAVPQAGRVQFTCAGQYRFALAVGALPPYRDPWWIVCLGAGFAVAVWVARRYIASSRAITRANAEPV